MYEIKSPLLGYTYVLEYNVRLTLLLGENYKLKSLYVDSFFPMGRAIAISARHMESLLGKINRE